MAPTLAIDADRLAAFCRRHAVRRLSLFGSYLRGSQEDDSDIDLLVEFLASATPTLLDLAGMDSPSAHFAGSNDRPCEIGVRGVG